MLKLLIVIHREIESAAKYIIVILTLQMIKPGAQFNHLKFLDLYF